MAASRILVAHDLSDAADRALAFALTMARELGATLDVVHVCRDGNDTSAASPGSGEWPAAAEELHRLRALNEELERHIEQVTGSKDDASVRHHVMRGDPATQLQKLALALGARAVCVGTTSKDAVERLLFGSVSRHLLRHSRIPVVSVP